MASSLPAPALSPPRLALVAAPSAFVPSPRHPLRALSAAQACSTPPHSEAECAAALVTPLFPLPSVGPLPGA